MPTAKKHRPPKWARDALSLRERWASVVGRDAWGYAVLDRLGLSDRLRRLFACACVRHPIVWALLDDPRSRDAIEVAEKYADGLCGDAVLQAARDAAWQAWHEKGEQWVHAAAATHAAAAAAAADAAAADAAAADAAADAAAAAAAATTAAAATHAAATTTAAAAAAADAAAAAAAHAAATHAAATATHAQMVDYQGRLLVAIVGPSWRLRREWRTDTAVLLASQMYEAREFSAMPILADAIQDAGCPDDSALLAQLRDPEAAWCRGARVLDELLRGP